VAVRIRSYLLALTFLAVCLLMVLRADRLEGVVPLSWYDRSIVAVVTPPVRLITAVRWKTAAFLRHYVFLVGASQENDRLKEQHAAILLDKTLRSDLERENERLRALHELRSNISEVTVSARVVSFPPLGEFRLVTIDKGTLSGIARRDPVIAPGGLVGQVIRVSPATAQVLLITDPTSAVDGRIQRTGARGLIVGKIRRLELEHDLFLGAFEFLNQAAELAAGDPVETTGLDGIYPPGIPIGVVHQVVRKKNEVFLGADIIPQVDFNKLREVLVVKMR